MASIAKLLRGSDREFFDLFERAGANITRATELPRAAFILEGILIKNG